GEGNREADVSQVKHRRMDHHLRILQQRIQPVAIFWDSAFHQREGGRCEVDDGQKEYLYAGEDGSRVGVKLDVGFVSQPQHEAVGPKEPCPKEKGTLLTAPKGRELVGTWQCPVRVLKDVGD